MLPQNQSLQSSGPNQHREPLQKFKIHVDLTEVYGEFFVGIAEEILQPLCSHPGQEHVMIEDYASMGPQIFGELVRAVFGMTLNRSSFIVTGQLHTTSQSPSLFSLRRYFPTETQNDGGPAQQLLERIYMGICSQVSRSEVGAKASLMRQYNRPVDIIHTHYPEPYIHVDGEGSYVLVYGEVYPYDNPPPDKLTDEDLDETEEDLGYTPPLQVQPMHPFIPSTSLLDQQIIRTDVDSILNTRF